MPTFNTIQATAIAGGILLSPLPVTAQSVYEWVAHAGSSPPYDWWTSAEWHMAFDSEQGHIYATPLHVIFNAWVWDGVTWSETAYVSPEDGSGMGYHESFDAVTRLQYTASLEPMNTLVLVDGVGWVQVDSNGPSSRWDFGWAYDSLRERIVLFGGKYRLQGPEPAFTWEWDGLNWYVYDTTEEGPVRRIYTAMAYDERNGVTVLHGGKEQGPRVYGDTWTWDGQNWQHHDVSGPGPRSYHTMIYDSHRQKVLLFGGGDENDTYLGDLWEWDGSSWTEVPVEGPPGRIYPGMAYDSARKQAVLFGGRRREMGKVVPLPKTWLLRIRETWVDFDYTGEETGDFETPYDTVSEAVAAMTPETRLRIKPGSTPETITISTPLILDAPLGTVLIGQ